MYVVIKLSVKTNISKPTLSCFLPIGMRIQIQAKRADTTICAYSDNLHNQAKDTQKLLRNQMCTLRVNEIEA